MRKIKVTVIKKAEPSVRVTAPAIENDSCLSKSVKNKSYILTTISKSDITLDAFKTLSEAQDAMLNDVIRVSNSEDYEITDYTAEYNSLVKYRWEILTVDKPYNETVKWECNTYAPTFDKLWAFNNPEAEKVTLVHIGKSIYTPDVSDEYLSITYISHNDIIKTADTTYSIEEFVAKAIKSGTSIGYDVGSMYGQTIKDLGTPNEILSIDNLEGMAEWLLSTAMKSREEESKDGEVKIKPYLLVCDSTYQTDYFTESTSRTEKRYATFAEAQNQMFTELVTVGRAPKNIVSACKKYSYNFGNYGFCEDEAWSDIGGKFRWQILFTDKKTLDSTEIKSEPLSEDAIIGNNDVWIYNDVAGKQIFGIAYNKSCDDIDESFVITYIPYISITSTFTKCCHNAAEITKKVALKGTNLFDAIYKCILTDKPDFICTDKNDSDFMEWLTENI